MTDNFLDPLKKIKKVDAPPFLFSKIQNRISGSDELNLNYRTILLGGLSLAMVILLNLAVMLNDPSVNNNKPEEGYYTGSSNTLYK
ncbi:MAG: hypothetical protein H6605_00355 [Flavobacteriales bacterium]|nr:hypothetical protein [Flavobacteriales bacterium]